MFNEHHLTLSALWAQLPAHVAQALLLSGEGETYLSRQASLLLDYINDHSSQVLMSVFADIALVAWEASLLDAQPASIVQYIHRQRPFITGQVAAFNATCAASRPLNS